MDNNELKQPAPSVNLEIKLPKPKKKRKWLKRLIIFIVIVAVILFIAFRILGASKQLTSGLYLQDTVTRRDLTVSVSGTATVQPTESYRVTALITGEVLGAPFEEGDTVQKGDLLYTIDAKDVENNIARAALSVEQAQLSYDALRESKADNMDNLELKATADGVMQTLLIEEGDMVVAGTAVAVILDRDTMTLTLPFHADNAKTFYKGLSATVTVGGSLETLTGLIDEITAVDEVGAGGTLVRQVTIKVPNPGAITTTTTGTATVGLYACASSGTFAYSTQETLVAKTSGKLSALYVSEGDRVYKGQVLGLYESTDLDNQIENARIGLESARLSLDSARDALENYNITSPISGTIIEKNYKAGDNIEATTSGYLAVIYDMSALTFQMNIDELDIGKIAAGQTVEITAEALDGRTFTGYVDKININGNTASGVTTYPVTVVINDPGDLFPGMNVTANIIVEHAIGALSIPVDAVKRGNTVLIPGEGAFDQAGLLADATKLQEVTVTLGRNDADYIEILSGLEEGDAVVIENQASSIYDLMMSGNGGGGGMAASPAE